MKIPESSPQQKTLPVMDASAITRSIRRIAHEICEQHSKASNLVLAGIPTRGVEIAKRLAEHISQISEIRPFVGTLDVSMHRDDLAVRRKMTAVQPTHLPVDLDGRPLIIVDDVLFTGRTCRAALDAISSFGRPSSIQLAVLIDRGHRELPIKADYVGKNLPTAPHDKIRVRFQELDGMPDSVELVKL